MAALALPWLAVAFVRVAGDWLEPRWLPFAVAVFVAAWVGGLRSGLLATAVATALAATWLVPSRPEVSHLLSIAFFVATGLLFSEFAGRLTRAHRQTERVLADAEALFAYASDAIFVADGEGRFLAVNDAACRLLGWSREELVGRGMGDLVRPEATDRLAGERRILAGGASLVSEWELRRKDGSFAPVEVSATILADGRWLGFARDVGELRRLAASLRATAADLERAQAVAHIGSWRLDAQRDEVRWSAENYRIFGVPPDQRMTYEAFLARVHPEDRAVVDERWKAALRGEPYDLEHRILVDGRVRWVREKADLAFDERGVLLGGIGITQDVTERRRLEDEQKRAEERFDLALRGADLAAWDWNVPTGEVVFNARWAEMRGYEPEEVRPHVDSWLDGVHPDDLPKVRDALRRHFDGGTPEYEAEHRVRTKGGEWIWIQDRGKVFARDAEGRPLRMCGTELDITERKREEEHQKLLAEVGSVFAASLDYEETLTAVAEQAARHLADVCVVYGIQEGEPRRLRVVTRDPAHAWIGRLIEAWTLQPEQPHDVWRVLGSRRSVLHVAPTPWMTEFFSQSDEHRRALAELDPRSLLMVPLLAHGKVLGAMALMASARSGPYRRSDVRRAEDLAVRAALALENARLFETANAAVRMRDEVMGIVAHDLRNPLGTIVMQAHLLQRRADLDAAARETGAGIATAARRMNRLIQDLLDVTRMEAGRLSLDVKPVSPDEVVREVVRSQAPLAAAKGLELRADLEGGLPEVLADHDRLLQVFENLVGNAVKFGGRGGVVTLGARQGDDEVLFWVADTGEGIPEESLPHVFDRFWQARKGVTQGAGLGLPIVKGIVEAHGGTIRVDSVPGRGTTFTFTIPRAAPRRSDLQAA